MNEERPAGSNTPVSRWWKRVSQRLSGIPHTRENLLELLRTVRDTQLLDADAYTMFEGILSTSETPVRDIMVPRAQMVVIERDWSLEQITEVVIESGHSRFPVIGDSRDEIVGVLLAKDLLRFGANMTATFDLERWLRPVQFVPESKRVNMLLKDFKRGRNHMAIVADEYGGVAGLVTIEDVLEQIVGRIDDEYDEAEGAHILKQDERRFLVAGLTPLEEFNAYFQAEFPTQEFDTIGGLVTQRFGHMPKRGESLRIEKFNFIVQRADSRRVQMLQVTLAPG
ncbi:MAG: HlyC/CorC family transporter [Panacagrimonas sp.]